MTDRLTDQQTTLLTDDQSIAWTAWSVGTDDADIVRQLKQGYFMLGLIV